MAETFSERVDVTDASGAVTIEIDGNASTLRVGKDGAIGRIGLRDGIGAETVRMDASPAGLRLGLKDNGGSLVIISSANRRTLEFFAGEAELRVGAQDQAGGFVALDALARRAFDFDGGTGRLSVQNGGVEIFRLDAGEAMLRLGGAGRPVDLAVSGSANDALRLDAAAASLTIGSRGNNAALVVRDSSDRRVFRFESEFGLLRVGAQGNGGDIRVRDDVGREVLKFDSNVAHLVVGERGNEGDITVLDSKGKNSIRLDGHTGTISTKNSDLAEQFDLAEAAEAPPGTVMALAQDGRLVPTTIAYDAAVIGVVAGGGRFRPGIIMGDGAESGGRRVPIALVGKAACRVDAGHGPVRAGDLLTSSPTSGHAMRADPKHAAGAVIGKALTGLDGGTGLVEMVISLQ